MLFKPQRPPGARARWAAIALTVCLGWPPLALAANLSLEEALSRAGAADLDLPVAAARIEAAKASAREAGLPPEAAIGVDVENFPSTGGLGDRAEATVRYERAFERGGKRSARLAAAEARVAAEALRGEVDHLNHLRDVQIAYAQALTAEAEVLIAEARLASAMQAQADIDRRVKSARDPLFAGARAQTLTLQAQIARDEAKAKAAEARAALARHWGGADDFTLDLEFFFAASTPAPPAAGAETPDLALIEAERDAAQATVRSEEAKGIADPTLSAGVRYLGDGSELAVVFGGRIPLQRGVRSRPAIERAYAQRNAAEAELIAATARRQREITSLIARMTASARESEAIRAEIIPMALNTVDLVRDGFNRGGFAYSDVVEAERALHEARARRVAVLHDYHLDRAAFDRLAAAHDHLMSHTEERR